MAELHRVEINEKAPNEIEPTEEKPAEVSETKQAGEATGRWTWVERAVWTDRMLEALETGVKGGVQPRRGSSTLAQRLFPRARVVLLNRSL